MPEQDSALGPAFKYLEETLRKYFKDNTITVKYDFEELEAYVEDGKFGMSDMFANEDLDCQIECDLDQVGLELEWQTGGTFWLVPVEE